MRGKGQKLFCLSRGQVCSGIALKSRPDSISGVHYLWSALFMHMYQLVVNDACVGSQLMLRQCTEDIDGITESEFCILCHLSPLCCLWVS